MDVFIFPRSVNLRGYLLLMSELLTKIENYSEVSKANKIFRCKWSKASNPAINIERKMEDCIDEWSSGVLLTR